MKVLAIGAHPDDIEICCAGTLVKCKERGDEVTVCHMSDGDMGHVVIMPEELGILRRGEAQRAGAVAGIKVIWGGLHDLDIYDEKKARDMIVKIIRDERPDFIITHGEDLMNNATGLNNVPTIYVDITEQMETKHKMFACHESQIVWLKDHDGVDTVEQIEIFARFYGLQCGVKYAEVFRERFASGRQCPARLLP